MKKNQFMKVYLQPNESLDGLMEVVQRKPTTSKPTYPINSPTRKKTGFNLGRNLTLGLATAFLLLSTPSMMPEQPRSYVTEPINRRRRDEVDYQNSLDAKVMEPNYELDPVSAEDAARIGEMEEGHSVTLPRGDYSLHQIMMEAEKQFSFAGSYMSQAKVVVSNYKMTEGKRLGNQPSMRLSGEVKITLMKPEDGQGVSNYNLTHLPTHSGGITPGHKEMVLQYTNQQKPEKQKTITVKPCVRNGEPAEYKLVIHTAKEPNKKI